MLLAAYELRNYLVWFHANWNIWWSFDPAFVSSVGTYDTLLEHLCHYGQMILFWLLYFYLLLILYWQYNTIQAWSAIIINWSESMKLMQKHEMRALLRVSSFSSRLAINWLQNPILRNSKDYKFYPIIGSTSSQSFHQFILVQLEFVD